MAEAGPGAAGGYVAFISYSHKDAAIGRWLHRKPEAYRLPRRLIGTEGEDGEVPARLTPIFRDRDELPAAGDLSGRVRAALAVTRSLIVICSPHSAASPWVAREIATFRELHPDRPIFAAIVEGEPDQCFPAALQAGGLEPLAADLRKQGDGRRLGLLKLVAGLTGVGLDQLVQRDAQRRIRRVTYVTAAAVAAMLVMALLTAFALNARAEAQRQRAEAEGLVQFMLTDLRDRLRGVGRLDVLTTVNQRALAYYRSRDLDNLPAESLERRARILQAMGEDDAKRGDLDRALAQYREAGRTTAALMAADPDNPERIYSHMQSEYGVANVAEQRGDFDTAMAAYRRYRVAAEKMYRLAPTNPRYVGERAYADSNIGIALLKGLKRPAAARAAFERSLRGFQATAAIEPERANWRVEAADAHAWIADCYFEEKRYSEARAIRVRETALKEALLRSDPNNLTYKYALVITARSLARIDIELGERARAERSLDDAGSSLDFLLRRDPQNVMWRDQAARLEADRAELYLDTGRGGDAEAALARARSLLRGGNGPLTAAQRKIMSRIDESARRLRPPA
jgi:tetratricopeptide (TPR) repeat protein